MPKISMPSSFSSKPGFYDESDPSNQSGYNNKPADANKTSQDTKKKSTQNGTNNSSKRFV